MVLAAENPRGARSNSGALADDVNDGASRGQSQQHRGTSDKLLDSGMAAGPMAVTPMASDGIERLAALLTAKEAEVRALQKTLDEYVASTGEYEKELETELQRCEHKTTALEGQAQSLEEGKMQLQEALTQTQHELAAANKREAAATAQVAEMRRTIQQLEQTNDELETATRVAQATIDELQHRVDTLTEENVFLVQEKEDALAAATAVVPETAAKDDAPEKDPGDANATGLESSNSRTASRRKGPRLPDVVECCLHLTCSHEQCRQVNPAAIAKAALVGATVSGAAGAAQSKTSKPTRRPFFERLRLRYFTRS